MAYVETAKPVQPCEAAILSLLFAVANWCFSLLFRTGSEPPNVLEGKGFSALPESLLSLHSRKSPCKWRWQGGSQVSTPGGATASDKTAGDAERQPKKWNQIFCDRVQSLFVSRASSLGYAARGVASARLPRARQSSGPRRAGRSETVHSRELTCQRAAASAAKLQRRNDPLDQDRANLQASSMIKSELVKCISSQNPHLYQRDIEKVVDAIFDKMVEALRRGDRVELRGFGTFSVKIREARQGRNPRTGVVVSVGKKAMPYFKTGKEMRARLNREIPPTD